MGSVEENVILIGIGLLLILFLALVLWMFLIVRYWRQKTQSDLKNMRGDLRRLQADRKRMMDIAYAHSKDDPEPYGTRVELFQLRMEEIEGQVISLEYQHVAMNEHIRRITSGQWRMLLRLPYLWYQTRRDVNALKIDLAETQAALKDASRDEKVISRFGWQVALEAREVWEIQQQVGELMSQLRAKNIHGDLMESATHREEKARNGLSQIPHYYLSGDEESVLELADKESIALAYGILQKFRPELVELKADAENWEMNYKRTGEKVAVLQRVLVATENQLSRMPPEIELSFEKTQLEQYKIIYENLFATLSRLEVESMADVIEEAMRVARISKDLETELKGARRYQAALEVVIPKLTEKLNNLSTQITDLGTHPTQPISWTHSTATLTNLMRQATEIGKVNKGRSLEKVERDLDMATRLNTECEELNQAIQQTRQQHVELLALYDTLEQRQVAQWMQYAQNLVVQVQVYAPENWAPIDGVRGLPSELDAFEGDVSRLLPSIQPEIIQDTEIQHRLNDTRELSATYNTLRRRIENIQNRLTDIQGSERSARKRMETAQAVFNQLSFIISSNDFLLGVAEKEINRVQGELHKLDSELATRQSGTIESKNKAVAKVISKFELYANRWLDLLTGEIEVKIDSIAASLAALDAISSLDERAILQARRLLASGQSMGLSSSDADTRTSLEKIVTIFKPRSDYWQSCTAALLALEDVERPVIESYTEANQNRQNVREQFAEIDTWLPAKRAWPPISATPDSEREEFNSIEESWKSLRGEHIRAITLVARLGNISARYQTLAERIYRVVETVQKDQDQIVELEMDINAFVHQWQSQVKAYRDNPAASKEIREMLEEIGSERSQIMQQYQRGEKNYRQVMEDLKMIQRKLNYFQVELDEDHALDINGRVIRRQ